MASQPENLQIESLMTLDLATYESWQQELARLRHDNEQLRSELTACKQLLTGHQQALEARFRLAAIVESSDDAIISKTLDGIIVSWNAGAERIFGYKAEEVIGQPIVLLVPNERLDEEPKILERLKRGERIEHFETIRKRRDGTLIHLSLTISPVRDDAGNIIGASKIARDISDRQRVEEALRQKEAQYRSIFEAVTDGMLITDLETGMLIAANPAMAQMHGYSPVEFKQLQPTDFIHPSSLLLFEKYLEIVRSGDQFHCQAVDIRKDGTPFDIEVTGTTCTYDGKPHALSIARDISDRKRAERQLQESQQLLQLVLNTIPHTVFWKDCNSIYQGVNHAFAKDAGFDSPVDIVGKSDYDLPWTTAESDWYRECDQRIIESDTAKLSIIETQLQADGSQIWIETSKLPLHDGNGTVIGILGIYQDVTDRKQAETELNQRTEELENTLQELQRTQMQMIQSEKMSGLGQLVAGVAHEINNPINFISGNLKHADAYIEGLLRLLRLYQQHDPKIHSAIQQEAERIDLEFLTQDLPKLLTSMQVGADRIQAIVASLRNFSRLDEAEMKDVNIHDGIDSTLMILQHRLKANSDFPGIEVLKDYGELPLVECYAGQLNQVFMNILSNAIDALEESLVAGHWSLAKEQITNDERHVTTPTIQIQTDVVDSQQVRIVVSDNGPGMTETVRKRLFDPFFTTKPVGKGTGMGMSISYQIITEMHQGSLQCISSSEQGTELVIEIPIRQQA